MLSLFFVGLMASPAHGADRTLPQIAKAEGFSTMKEALDEVVASAKSPKKLEKALAESQLEQVAMPVALAGGAELVFSQASDLSGCAWNDGVTCTFSVAGVGSPNDYRLVCVTKFGSTLDFEPIPSPAPAGRVGFAVADVDKCWALGGRSLRLLPGALMDLEGVGKGTEYIPPELVELSWRQAEEVIAGHMASFRYCFQQAEEGEAGRQGKLIVKYKIAEDGSVASVESKTSTLNDMSIQRCILSRFERVAFPPPRGGFTGGTYPFTFSH
jgi:hypothetical protein